MCVPQVDIHIENKVRDLLNHTGDGKISTKLLRVFHVAAATGLQVTGVRCSMDRRDIENDEFSGFRQRFSELIAGVLQPPLLVRAWSIHFALQAGINQLEIKHSNFGRICMRRCGDQEG